MSTELNVKYLKDCLDALEKLRGMRRELKQRLGREGLLDREEISLADELAKVSRQIEYLEKERLVALDPLPGSTHMNPASASAGRTKQRKA
jgi:hypothetical protein